MGVLRMCGTAFCEMERERACCFAKAPKPKLWLRPAAAARRKTQRSAIDALCAALLSASPLARSAPLPFAASASSQQQQQQKQQHTQTHGADEMASPAAAATAAARDRDRAPNAPHAAHSAPPRAAHAAPKPPHAVEGEGAAAAAQQQQQPPPPHERPTTTLGRYLAARLGEVGCDHSEQSGRTGLDWV